MKGKFISRPTSKNISTKSKVGIIVASDLKNESTNYFIDEMIHLISSHDIKYKLILVNEKSKVKNKAKIYNAGFNIAKQNKCDYMIFQNENFIPTTNNLGYYLTYPVDPINMSFHTSKNKINVLSINISDFEKLGGFNMSSNNIGKSFHTDLKRHNIRLNLPSINSYIIQEKNNLNIKSKTKHIKQSFHNFKYEVIESHVISDNISYYLID